MRNHAITSANVQHVLERFSDSSLVANGQMVLVSVEAIRERMGRRWPMRRESVWEFLERLFSKEFSSADHISRVDDDLFLLVLPSLPRLSAQGRAINLLRDVLEFFLGRVDGVDLKVSRVSGIGPNGIEHVVLSSAEVTQARQAAERLQTAQPQPAAGSDLEPVVRKSLHLTEPIWSIRKRAVVSFRFRALGFDTTDSGELLPADPTQLRTCDVVDHDLESLQAGLDLIRLNEDRRRFALHVAVRFESLFSSRRREILSVLHAQASRAQASAVISVEGLDSGTPPGRLSEVASLLKPLCLGVVAQASGLDTDVTRWSGAPIDAIAVDLQTLSSRDKDGLSSGLARFAVRAQALRWSIIAHAVTCSATSLAAWSAGFTHLSGDAVGDRLGAPLTPVRFEPTDLYTRRPGQAERSTYGVGAVGRK